MSEEAAFLEAIRAEPGDLVARGVYADWLEERGDPRAEYLRLLCSSATQWGPGGGADATLKRMRELRETADLEWVARMHRGVGLGPRGMALAPLLEELKHAYKVRGLDCGAQLLRPASPEALAEAERRLGVPLPAELREVYAAHGGQRYFSAGTTGLFGRHRLHTPIQLGKEHRMLCDNCIPDHPDSFPGRGRKDGYFQRRLLPFASWDAYDLCIDARSWEVWEFEPWSGVRHKSRRPHLAAVIRELLAQMRVGNAPRL